MSASYDNPTNSHLPAASTRGCPGFREADADEYVDTGLSRLPRVCPGAARLPWGCPASTGLPGFRGGKRDDDGDVDTPVPGGPSTPREAVLGCNAEALTIVRLSNFGETLGHFAVDPDSPLQAMALLRAAMARHLHTLSRRISLIWRGAPLALADVTEICAAPEAERDVIAIANRRPDDDFLQPCFFAWARFLDLIPPSLPDSSSESDVMPSLVDSSSSQGVDALESDSDSLSESETETWVVLARPTGSRTRGRP